MKKGLIKAALRQATNKIINKKSIFRYLGLLTAGLFAAFLSISSALAANLYISDELYVPVRKGQGNQFAILHKGLPSGTRVTLIERDKDWTKVQTAGGITGWIRNQFLNPTPPAKLQLTEAKKNLKNLSEQLKTLKEEKNNLEKTYTETQQSLKQTEKRANKTADELSSLKIISASAVESHKRLQSIAEKMQLLQTENDVLKSENESLRRSENTTFFLYGAFTVLLGVLIAIILPKLRLRKHNNGWLN